MKKKFLYSLIFIVLVLVLSGCFESKEEKVKRKEYSKQASTNAINYIKNKYGFTPKVVSTHCTFDDSDMFASECNNTMNVILEYNGKEFHVFIDGSKEETRGKDNYQYDEIVNDLLKEIKKDIDVEPYKYSVSYGYDDVNGLIDTYYDGSNLNEALKGVRVDISLDYVNNVNLEMIQSINLLQTLDSCSISLINYKSEDLAKVYSGGSYFNIYEIAPNINEALTLSKSERKYYKFDLKQFDGIYYGDVKNNKEVNLNYGQMSDPENWEGHGAHNPTQITKTYSIDATLDSIYLYIPVSMLGNTSNLDVAYECERNGEPYYFTSRLNAYKNSIYAVSSIYLNSCTNVKFAVFRSKY